jgi:hypothetical protein
MRIADVNPEELPMGLTNKYNIFTSQAKLNPVSNYLTNCKEQSL